MDESDLEKTTYLHLKNKLIYFVCFGTMLTILGGVFYICFFREIHIDLTNNLQVKFVGENGHGRIVSDRYDLNYNQRISTFYESLNISYSNEWNLSNGDEVTIEIFFDEQLAEQFNIVVDANSLVVVVEGLAERYATKDDISSAILQKITEKSTSYMKKDGERILHQDFTLASDVTLKSETMIQRVFLKADDTQVHDKIVDVYQMVATGKHEDGSQGEETIYYMVVIDDINSNMIINDDQVYGEKALFTDEDLTTKEGIIRYFKSKYVLSYEVELI